MKRSLYLIFFAIISFALYSYESLSMRRIEFLKDNSLPSGTKYLIMMLVVSVLSLIIFKNNPIKRIKTASAFKSLLIWVYIISIVYSFLLPFSRANYVLIILPLFLLYFSSFYAKYVKTDEVIVWSMTFVAIGLLLHFIKGLSSSFTMMRTGASYYIAYFLPFFLCHKNTIVKLVCVILTFAAVVISVKIGGLLCVSVAVMVYLFIKQKVNNFKQCSFKAFYILAIIALLLYWVVLYLDNNVLGGIFINHIGESSDSGGSGRLEIYGMYLKLIFNSSILKFLFGHGWLGSENVSSLGLTCHNDFLEAFFDFGLIGFVLYVFFHLSLFSLCRKLVRHRSKYAPVMCASVAEFFINSMVSHIFIYPWYFMIFTFFWGFVMSNIENSKNIRKLV